VKHLFTFNLWKLLRKITCRRFNFDFLKLHRNKASFKFIEDFYDSNHDYITYQWLEEISMDNLLLKNLETYGDYDFKYNTDRKKTTLFGSSKIKTI
jgi:hypothetical protein